MIWLNFGGSYRCSNCYTMPDFADIRNIKTCPKCHHRSDGFESIHGVLPMDITDEEIEQRVKEHQNGNS